jgi:hypothetical protein
MRSTQGPPEDPRGRVGGASESFADREASQHGRQALAHAQHRDRVPRLAGRRWHTAALEFGSGFVRGEPLKLGEDFAQGCCAANSCFLIGLGEGSVGSRPYRRWQS